MQRMRWKACALHRNFLKRKHNKIREDLCPPVFYSWAQYIFDKTKVKDTVNTLAAARMHNHTPIAFFIFITPKRLILNFTLIIYHKCNSHSKAFHHSLDLFNKRVYWQKRRYFCANAILSCYLTCKLCIKSIILLLSWSYDCDIIVNWKM